MGKSTKAVVLEDTGTGIFYKCGYEEGHCSTIPIGYPLQSLPFRSLTPAISDLVVSRHLTGVIVVRRCDGGCGGGGWTTEEDSGGEEKLREGRED